MLYVSLICLAFYAHTCNAMLSKRKASVPQPTEVAPTVQLHPADDPLTRQLRKVLCREPDYFSQEDDDYQEDDANEPALQMVSDTPTVIASPPLRETCDASPFSGQTSPYNFGSPTAQSPAPIAAPIQRARIPRSLSASTLHSSTNSLSDKVKDLVRQSGCKACTETYHGRNELGLAVEWLATLPAEQIQFRGGNLDARQEEQLLGLLRSLSKSVTTNSRTDDDTEKIFVDLSILNYLPQLAIAAPTPHTPEPKPEVSLAELNARHLFTIEPANILLKKDGQVQSTTLAQKTLARDFILQALHAISVKEDGNLITLYIDLDHMPKDTKVPGTPPTKSIRRTTKNGDNLPLVTTSESTRTHIPTSAPKAVPQTNLIAHYAPSVLKGASLIALGYLFAQFMHK